MSDKGKRAAAQTFHRRWMAAELPRLLADLELFKSLPRTGGRRKPQYTEAEARGWVCVMLTRCADLKMPPPPELAKAVYLLLGAPGLPRGDITKLRGSEQGQVWAWVQASLFEARHPADPTATDPTADPNKVKPSTASVNAVAKHAGVVPDTIRRWRKNDFYRQSVHMSRFAAQEEQPPG